MTSSGQVQWLAEVMAQVGLPPDAVAMTALGVAVAYLLVSVVVGCVVGRMLRDSST